MDGDLAELRRLIEQARRETALDLDASAFEAYVLERVTLEPHVLRSLHVADLWIAFGCVRADGAALALFETRFAPEIRKALARSFERALAEDAEARLRERLFLVEDDAVSKLASYAGRGALGPWLRATAIRTAIDVMRARKELPADPAHLADAALTDPLLARLKDSYRAEFRVAFSHAVGALTDRERTLLRYRFVDGLSIDEIGTLYRVHRATIARWIAGARESLFETTRVQLMSQLQITESDVDSVLRLIDSQLEISIEAMMR